MPVGGSCPSLAGEGGSDDAIGRIWRLVKYDVPIPPEKLTKNVVAKYYLADERWLIVESFGKAAA